MELAAESLALLTPGPQVAVHFGTAEERPLGDVTLAEMDRLTEDGHFPPGSMGPKVQAAAEFLRAGGRLSIITSLDLLASAVSGRAGTRVRPGTDAA